MKTARFIPLLILPLLFSCLAKKPEIPMSEAPAGPLLQELEQRRRSFSTLRALGSIKAVRKDRRRSFDTVGFLVQKEERFRIEAYGPLGQTLNTLLWTGKDLMLDVDGDRRIVSGRSSGLERILGTDVDPSELCALLSGSVPAAEADTGRLFCAENGMCVLELRRGETTMRVHPNPGWESGEPAVRFYETFRKGNLVYRVRFENFAQISAYTLPQRIMIDNPDKRVSLTIEYAEAEINVSLDDRLFVIP